METHEKKEVMTVNEFAEATGIHYATVRKLIKEAKDARFIGRLINKFLEDSSIETPIDLFKSYYEVKESYCFWGMLVNEGILNIVDSRPSTVFSYQTIYRLEFSNDKLKEQFIKAVNDKN
jgi:hypothetical protein